MKRMLWVKRMVWLALCSSLVALISTASAQPNAPASAAPASAVASAAPSEKAAHPAPTSAGSAAPANPHAENPHAANPHAANPHAAMPRDRTEIDKTLPKGTIVAQIVDAAGTPQTGVQLELSQVFQSIAEGDQKDAKSATTNQQGEVVFRDQPAGSNFTYRITVKKGAAEFASQHFQLSREHGHRVLLHVYPVTHDPKLARIAMRGLIYVEPRDDLFQCEVWFQIYNLGQQTWVPQGVSLDLPGGSKAFTARESMRDTRFEADGDERAKLLGTFTPGQHDVRFAIQVPNEQRGTADFYLSLPPHVGEFRVVTQAIPGMSLKVADFPATQDSTGFQGERVLVSQKRANDLHAVHFTLAGLPTRGSAPWIAVLIAAFAAASGLYSARTHAKAPKQQKRRKLQGDVKEARDVIVAELVALERAKTAGEVGPKSYERTRRVLTAALARILQ